MSLQITHSFDPMLTFSLFLAFILWAIIWKIFRLYSSKPLNLPPGPRQLPVIGNLHQFMINGALPYRRLAGWAKKYGAIMQIQLGQVPVVIISTPETAKQVLTTHDLVFAIRPPLIVSDIIFYKGADIAFTPYGDLWKQLRRICMTELLSPSRVKSLRSVREEAVTKLVSSISSREGSPVNLSKMLHSLACTVISRATFGDECEDQEEIIPIAEEVLKMATGICISDLFPSSKILHFFTGIRYRLMKLHKKIDSVLQNIVNKHKVSRAASGINMEGKDIVHVLLNLQEQGNLELPLTTDNIKGVILDMLFGGIDTTAALIEWVMSEMIKNPKWMQKVQEEVRQVFSAKVDEADFDKLKYMKLIIKETLRLHPPVPLQPARQAAHHCQINGYDIPAETRILINFWALGRDPNYWSEPEKFIPERFIDNQIDYKGVSFEYLPFGSGRRICPGMVFGMATVEHTVARLLYQFDWKLSDDNKKKKELDMMEKFGIIGKRKNDLYLVPISYHNSM
ncbi:desmethyl-deoxy-podophyllotoxin synthase-like [Mercurialis annua]|uniref:desmethyl-deoxy-podophyllotoxin synthase-like n=1 Tax=Mercurialis annua TaxID=3986 RepID=UPI00215EA337|nr:desmethyl-deoxy-podophyllotoxin synthase-like [Mercurialis annua]